MKKNIIFTPEKERDSSVIIEDIDTSYNNLDNRGAIKRERIHREAKFVIMALLLVVSVLTGTLYKMMTCSSYITREELLNYTTVSSVMTDRFGNKIYTDGKVSNYPLYGNVVGCGEQIHNSLLYRYSDVLTQSEINPVYGDSSLETEPRVLKTTLLSEESLQEILDLFGGRNGCCFAYNYETGEVYTAITAPYFSPDIADPTYINRCFDSLYIPGSTMKIITAALAVDQGIDVSKVEYTCEESFTLNDGNKINCTAYHGKIDFSTAIGRSCNCYFAQLITDLDLNKALESLDKMGFAVNGESKDSSMMDGITIKTPSTVVANTSNFRDVWGLIGQGDSLVNPVYMAQAAAAIVNNGKAAKPYLVSSIINPNHSDEVIYQSETKMTRVLSSKTADKTAEFWKKAVDELYYSGHAMSDLISYAKTGTAQQGDGTENKLLVGVSKSTKTAFYIVVEGGGVDPMEIANKLICLVP
ncbi:MAG: hypothetical protein E7591_04560 [Ruminococcaceae bacterium]|nr:hypothetical protein [Oscillospiraceae bacterium]